jgi:hypothetical protein
VAKRYQAFVISEGKDDKKYWRQIGAAFENRDGSINVKIDAFPINGELQLRIPQERDENADSGNGGGSTRTSNTNSNNNRGTRR